MAATLSLVVRPDWLSGWFLRVCAVPFVLIDGEEHRAAWNRPLRLGLPSGRRLVGAGIRYRGTQALLGYHPTVIDVRPNEEIRMVAQNGPLNSEPFYVRAVP